jgi:mannose-1-phosphate guanylyltransferase/mannose-6-phosphate isomerase
MISVIIAGGSGTRLWPLSTPDYPKHLLSLTNERSLLQNSLDRVSDLSDSDKTFIITEASHAHHVRDQLSELPKDNLLIEPARRGTSNCVLLAMRHVNKLGLPADEPIAILWADHLIRDENGFKRTFKRASRLTQKYKKVVFIGAEPSYPSTGFGYMEHGQEIDNEPETFELLRFHEKPDHATADKYFESGRFFWNMGYLVTTLESFEEAVETYAPHFWQTYQQLLAADDLEAAYLKLESDALDYAFSERVKGALVIPGSFDWTDVGSFGDLHDISVHDKEGNYTHGESIVLDGVTNSYIHTQGGIPLAVVGLDNVVVIQSEHGILVTNKNFAQKVGDVSKKLQQAKD